MSTTSQNAVQNKVVTGELNSVKETLTNQVNVNGVKNLFPPCTDWMSFPEKTYNNVTLKCSDDSFTLSGTSSASGTIGFNFFHELYGFDSLMELFRNLIGKEIVLSIGNAFNNGNTRMLIIFVNSSHTEISRLEIKGTNTYVTGVVPSGTVGVECQIYVPNGTAAFSPSVVYKPMLCLKSDWDMDNTYEPPAMTNRQLTTEKVGMDLLSEVGAVNALKNTLAVGTTVDATSGLTYTVDSDGVVTVVPTSGTYPFTTTAKLQLQVCRTPVFPYLPCKLMGCPEGGTDYTTGYALYYANWSNANGVVYDNGSGAIIQNQFNYSSYPYARIAINIASGTVLTKALVFKPQIAPPEYNGDYAPPAKTNRELTEDVADIPYVALTDNASSQYTLTEGKMWQTKGVTFLFVGVTCNTVSPISGGSHIKIAAIPSKFKKPQFNMYPCIANYKDGSTHIGAQLQIAASGQIAIRGGETGASYAGLFSY